MAFDETIRVIFDSSTDPLNQQISQQLTALDGEAAQIRDAGRSPQHDLRPKVDLLKGAITRARIETLTHIDNSIGEIRNQWLDNRDKHPDRELARLRRAENEIGGLSDKECADLAINYASEAADLDGPSLNVLKGRLRQGKADVELEVLAEGIAARRGDRPWISTDPDATAMADHADRLEKLTGGQVFFENEDGREIFDVEKMIDYEGELSALE